MTGSVTGILWKSLLATAISVPFLLVGCGRTSGPDGAGQRGDKATGKTAEAPKEGEADGQDEEAEIKAARAELSPEDQRLVEAQDFCPIMPDKRLGVMGKPFKVTINDQPVFLCCKGCRRRALADPDKTLAKVEELKAKGRHKEAGKGDEHAKHAEAQKAGHKGEQRGKHDDHKKDGHKRGEHTDHKDGQHHDKETAPQGSVKVGDKVPDFSVRTLDGKSVKLSELQKDERRTKKGVVVLSFWCSTCHSCRDVEHLLAKLSKDYEGQVAVIALDANADDTAESVAAFVKKNGLELPVVLDPSGNTADLFGVKRTTTTVVIDGTGVLRYCGQFRQKGGGSAEEALKAVLAGKEVAVKTTPHNG